MRITLTGPHDTIVMDGDGSLDHDLTILKDGVTGWYSTPAVREAGLDRPQQDGCYWPSRLTQPGRTVSIHVLEHAISSVQAALMSQRLCALMGHALTLTVEDQLGTRTCTCWLADDPAAGMLVTQTAFECTLVLYCPDPYNALTLTVEDQLGTRTCTCWLADDPAAGMLVTQTAFECTLVLYCPDPYKYGEWLWQAPQSGRLALVDLGTAPTWIRFRAMSKITTLYAAWDDAEIEWEGDTNDLLLDTRDMIPSAGQVTADWALPVQPGNTLLTIRSDCSTLDVGIRPAWR